GTIVSDPAHVRSYRHSDAIAPTDLRKIRDNPVPTSIGEWTVLAVRQGRRFCERQGASSSRDAAGGIGRVGVGFDSLTNPYARARFRRYICGSCTTRSFFLVCQLSP